jgi:hypothetical protein
VQVGRAAKKRGAMARIARQDLRGSAHAHPWPPAPVAWRCGWPARAGRIAQRLDRDRPLRVLEKGEQREQGPCAPGARIRRSTLRPGSLSSSHAAPAFRSARVPPTS